MKCNAASFCLLGALLTACGRPSEDLQTYSKLHGETETIAQPHDPELPPDLVFRSHQKKFDIKETTLGIKFGWFVFETALGASLDFSFETDEGLILSKRRLSDDSGIFSDDDGNLDVRPTDTFTGRCVYRASAMLQTYFEGELTLAGSKVEVRKGRERLLQVDSIATEFPIQLGDSLQSLEEGCARKFQESLKEPVHRDLGRAVASQLRIGRHTDQRVEALRSILAEVETDMIQASSRWKVQPVQLIKSSESHEVRGQLVWQRSGTQRRFSYSLSFAPETGELLSSSVMPHTADDVYAEALLVSGYIARNKWGFEDAREKGKTYYVDTALLHHE